MNNSLRLAAILACVSSSYVGLSGCGQDGGEPAGPMSTASSPGSPSGGASPLGATDSEMEARKLAPENGPASPQGPQVPPTAIQLASFEQAQPDRYLIKNASLSLQVKDARAALSRITGAVQAARGYLSEMGETVDALGVRSIVMDVRVPARRFDGAMGDIEGLGKVMDRQVSAEDVTEEFVDAQSRLRNLKRTEDRLLAHLGRTGKLSDTLLVERELTRVRQDVEQLEGRIRFLAHRISYSTISVTLREAAKATSPVPPESFSSGQIASEATRSLVRFSQSIWSIIIWFAIWAPVWIPLLLGAALAYRQLRRFPSDAAPA